MIIPMLSPEYLLVYVTFPETEPERGKILRDAETFCETLVRERLASGGTVLHGGSSVYWWRGSLQTARECVCLLQTTRTIFPAFLIRAKAIHPYEVPCIAALPLDQGNNDFFAWIKTETALRD
ncbi:divalent-cation tolerance protein CutA [Deltaproteobacteria bacterium]|nr:divalent-cation tolerance protein CutA [Deltaproteobacteria bacterium]